MTDEEINQRIHKEIMGGKCYHKYKAPLSIYPVCELCLEIVSVPNPDYCRDVKQARRVMDKIHELKKHLDFTKHLCEIVHAPYMSIRAQAYWRVAYASPKDICLAALKTLE